jgi:hypothetical protein
MVAAIKQQVTVGEDGTIVVRGTDLKPGTRAEVIVLVESQPAAPADKPMSQLEAFRALQASMNLSPEAAEKWAAENRELRKWNRPRG